MLGFETSQRHDGISISQILQGSQGSSAEFISDFASEHVVKLEVLSESEPGLRLRTNPLQKKKSDSTDRFQCGLALHCKDLQSCLQQMQHLRILMNFVFLFGRVAAGRGSDLTVIF